MEDRNKINLADLIEMSRIPDDYKVVGIPRPVKSVVIEVFTLNRITQLYKDVRDLLANCNRGKTVLCFYLG